MSTTTQALLCRPQLAPLRPRRQRSLGLHLARFPNRLTSPHLHQIILQMASYKKSSWKRHPTTGIQQKRQTNNPISSPCLISFRIRDIRLNLKMGSDFSLHFCLISLSEFPGLMSHRRGQVISSHLASSYVAFNSHRLASHEGDWTHLPCSRLVLMPERFPSHVPL